MRNLKRIPFTKPGLEKIKKEYAALLASRDEAVQTLKQARELGDLSENGLYKAARARLTGIDANIRRISFIIKLAEVPEKAEKGVVGIGSAVTVKDERGTRTFHIVGGYESDPLTGKISQNSPIGRALIGRKIGDTVTVLIPNGSVEYTITKVT